MIHHFREKNSLSRYVSKRCWGMFPLGNSIYQNHRCTLYAETSLKTLKRFYNGYNEKYSSQRIRYNENYKKSDKEEPFKEKDKFYENGKEEKINGFMYYPDYNSPFPYVTICIILGMVGISSFIQLLIYNLKNCNDESSIILQVNEILNYLDNYFIIHNFEEPPKCESSNENGTFNIKYLTSPFFANENVLQCAVQLSTFFLASRFLEKHYGSLKFGTLFLCGSIFSNLITYHFLKYIVKKMESLNFLNFVLIHPSGSMAFICALCSICFKNCAIWKGIPVHCSILVVPYLFSSFYGFLSLYKIRKHNLETSHGEMGSKKADAKQGNSLLNMDTKNYPHQGSQPYGAEYEVADMNKTSCGNTNELIDPNTSNEKERSYGHLNRKLMENDKIVIPLQGNQSEALNTLRNFLIVKACDAIIKRRKKENMFLNKKFQNMKNEALRNINEINNNSKKIFFGISSSFTDIFGILLASSAALLLKILK
ncbi:hypothetical protein, conserved [Plasmodium gonderi]|uniref:Uncharacterized protein n=1 Tax=Plasmodium gonderi TaxID=77519 RepID=A0A1Y1JA05_PLAGO|nr:hypothetical protein, conserved [Plasmodium gonderi]GAW79326.1 hypothetical protein, conserved [Plasmodium gonderi]